MGPLHFPHRRESWRPARSRGREARSTTAISRHAGHTPSPPQYASRPARPQPTDNLPVTNPQAPHVNSTTEPMAGTLPPASGDYNCAAPPDAPAFPSPPWFGY